MELCHYTTLDSLLGIIEGNAIWASHLRYLNDSTELLHGINCVKQSLDKLREESNLDSRWIDEIEKQVNLQITPGMEDIYVTCFYAGIYADGKYRDASDLLSQWRGYSKPKQGICIVFDSEKLIDFIYSAQQFKHEYKGESCHSTSFDVVHGLVNYVSPKNHKGAKKIYDIITSELEMFGSHSEIFLSSELGKSGVIASLLIRTLPFFKDSGFSEENEFRIAINTVTNRSLVNFRNNQELLTPYISIGTNERTNTYNFIPIKKIVVGPGPNSQINAISISNIISERNLNIKVDVSKIPYKG
ncbi:DUF2971 domain-containing protein [Klebsiella quasipneumoniae]